MGEIRSTAFIKQIVFQIGDIQLPAHILFTPEDFKEKTTLTVLLLNLFKYACYVYT